MWSAAAVIGAVGELRLDVSSIAMRFAVVAVSILVGCAHAPDLALRPEPAPPGQDVGVFAAADGTQLWRRHWRPTAPQRGVLVIEHGLADHSDNYDHLARRAAAAGFSVWAADLRGHARSAGPRVAPRRWHDYVDDLARFLDLVRAAEPGQPIFLFGHSMGGAIATLTVIERRPALAGLILSGAALDLGVPPIAVAAARLAGVLTPGFGALKLDPHAFSSDRAAGDRLARDPLVEHGPGPARTAAGLAAATADIWAGLDRLTLPILALHGTADKLTAPAGSRALIVRAPSRDKTLRIYAGFAHDLVHEPGGARVEDDLLAWLAAHTGGPAVTAPPVYAGPLRGDPRHLLTSVRIGGGVVGDDPGELAGAFELAVAVGKGAPVGWGGALTVRASGDGVAAALLPVGLTLRLGAGGLGVAAGISTVPDGFHPSVPLAAWLELPLGPVHATASAQLDYRLTDDPARAAPLSSDLAELGLALRVPGDRAYWPTTHAGVGPYLRGAILDAGGGAAYLVTAGLALYGAD